jgi:KipI family sensor histidine kinase inhibitor
MARYLACGEAAITVEFGDEISPELHRQVRAFALAIEQDPPPGLLELMPTYRSVTVQFDASHPEADQMELRLREAEASSTSIEVRPGKLHVMPVHYGGEDGPDLDDVARLHDLTADQAIDLHSNREYVVYCVGFSPGFAYLGGLPAELHTPRLGTPRKLVPAGTVGIGGQQTGVYPVPTPGGWRLLGRTNFTLFDVNAEPPCPLKVGDRVLFRAVDRLKRGANARMSVAAQPAGQPVLEVLKPGLFTTVQDLGRWGYQASGVSVAGAMDPLALRMANGLVGNEPDAGALEITLLGPTLRAVGACIVALAGAEVEPRLNGRPVMGTVELKVGDELEVGRTVRGARAYLAVGGGIDVPLVLGSRSTYTRAGFGGLEGRALRAGDTICHAERSEESAPRERIPHSARNDKWLPLPSGDEITVRVVLGPQDDYFSVETIEEFLRKAFQISSDADRMGYRLAGHPLHHQGPAEIVSDGVVLGSIQIPPHGNPIVMLADRPSVGGYPKIATVIGSDVRLVAQCRPGMRLHFRQVSVAEARQALREETTGDPRLPVEEVRDLLSAMHRAGARQAEVESPGLRIRLDR